MKNANFSTKSINILGILELGSIIWMNFLTNKTQNMDLTALFLGIETIFLLRLGTAYSTYKNYYLVFMYSTIYIV